MAARKNRVHHNDKSREKIQVSQLVNRLSDHALGKVEMTNTQVRAIEILLKKKLPDLSNIEHTGDPDNPVALTGINVVLKDAN